MSDWFFWAFPLGHQRRVFCIPIAEVGLPDGVQADNGHAPDYRVDRPSLQHEQKPPARRSLKPGMRVAQCSSQVQWSVITSQPAAEPRRAAGLAETPFYAAHDSASPE
jgi:hypothetical protein